MHGKLDERTQKQIESLLPDLVELANRVLMGLNPVGVSVAFDPESSIPVAAPCLGDALHVTGEARYALREAFAHLAWYREKRPEGPNEPAAVFLAGFYATAASSCLYAAGEDVANAIVEMFEIDRQELDPEGGKQTSLQSKVGAFLLKCMPTHRVSTSVVALAESVEWRNTIKWRNRWVHEQASVRGLGIVYEREKRWKRCVGADGSQGFILPFGGGDLQEYCVDDVLGFVKCAYSEFVRTFSEVVTCYEGIVSNARIRFSAGASSTT